VQYYYTELYRSALEFIIYFLFFPLVSLSIKSGGIQIFSPFLGAKSVLKHFKNVTENAQIGAKLKQYWSSQNLSAFVWTVIWCVGVILKQWR
jgi:hypothetical protein